MHAQVWLGYTCATFHCWQGSWACLSYLTLLIRRQHALFVRLSPSRALLEGSNGIAVYTTQVPEGARGFRRANPFVMASSFLLLVAGAIAIGFAPIFVRLAATGPIATAFWRMALAVPILWIISRYQNTLDKGTFRSPWIWVAGLAFALDLAAWHFAIRLTSVTNATLLANCAVLLVPPLSWLFLRRAVRLSTIGYGALAFLGIALLSSPSLHGGEQLLGDALALVTAAFYAAYLVAVAAARQRIGAAALALASSLLSSLALLLFVPLAGEKLLPAVAIDWIWLVGLAVISQVFGQTAIAHAMGRIPPAQAAIGLLIQPVSAAVFAWVLFQESMSGLQLFGGALVLIAITAVRLFDR
jgi:drug/metabolite transporter (DMT)-like permease